MTSKNGRLWACLVLSVFLATGCNKVAEFLRSNKDGDIRYCNIKKLRVMVDYPREFTFTYNRHGLPVSAVVDNPGTAVPSRYFYYDNRNRLIRMEGLYNPESFETWTIYLHDNKGRIIRDTTWWWGAVVNGQMASAMGYTTTDFEYDNWDRLTKTIHRWDLDPNFVLTEEYAYDDDGNLILDGVVYDNKINLHRTNKIWMFLNRNYSVNNPFNAASYNNNKLPTKLDMGDVYFDPARFFNLQLSRSEMEYICN